MEERPTLDDLLEERVGELRMGALEGHPETLVGWVCVWVGMKWL